MKARAKLRALLIAVAVVVGLIDGCPVPSQRNLERWPPALQPFGAKLAATRAWLMTPFAWIGSGLAVHQRWSLFTNANASRFRLWVEARRGEQPWQVLYRPHDPKHSYQARVIEYRRLRGGWNAYKSGPSAGYSPFVDWISRTVFQDPALEFDEVRVRMESIEASAFVTELTGTGEFQHEQRRSRAALLGVGVSP